MKRDGKWLEELLKTVEERIGGEGIKVESQVREFDEHGHQIAEFDIIVTGRIGSITLNALIECRDRPSQGAAPGNWIEQLIGRQKRFGFGKVIAVSTTGFSPSAIAAASDAGIELRCVAEVTAETITRWISEFRFKYFIIESHITNADFTLSKRTQKIAISAFQEIIQSTTSQEIRFSICGEPGQHSTKEIFSRFVAHDKDEASHHADLGTPVQFLLDLHQENVVLLKKTRRGPAFVESITFTVSYVRRSVPLTRSFTKYERSGEDTPIMESVQFVSPEGPDQFKLELSFLPTEL